MSDDLASDSGDEADMRKQSNVEKQKDAVKEKLTIAKETFHHLQPTLVLQIYHHRGGPVTQCKSNHRPKPTDACFYEILSNTTKTIPKLSHSLMHLCRALPTTLQLNKQSTPNHTSTKQAEHSQPHFN